MIYAALGDKDAAFIWLEKVYAERAVRRFLFLNIDPVFDSLRSDSRFVDLLRRMELTTGASAKPNAAYLGQMGAA